MAKLLDLSVFNFSTEEIRNINELIMEEILQAPELSVLHTIYPGIVTDKYIGFIGEAGMVGLPAQDCDPVPQQWSIPGEQKLWKPKRWEVFLTECWKDLENTMSIYSLNKGVNIGDLTNTDYMAIVVKVLGDAIKKMIWRFVWFGDTDADNFSNGGILSNGIDVEYFRLIDGFWKQLNVAAPVNDPKRIAIAANTGTTAKDQMDQLTGIKSYELLIKMYEKAGIVLRNQADVLFACTQSFADGYVKYLEEKDIEASYTNLVDGVKALNFRGIPVVPFAVWDEMIFNYENNGTKLNNPHRCVLTTKANLAIGVAGTDVLSEVDVWYEKKEDRNYMRSRDSIDAKLLHEKLFVLAI